MKFEIYKDKAHEWRWRIVSRNGRITACSGESFTTERDARRSILNLRRYIYVHGLEEKIRA